MQKVNLCRLFPIAFFSSIYTHTATWIQVNSDVSASNYLNVIRGPGSCLFQSRVLLFMVSKEAWKSKGLTCFFVNKSPKSCTLSRIVKQSRKPAPFRISRSLAVEWQSSWRYMISCYPWRSEPVSCLKTQFKFWAASGKEKVTSTWLNVMDCAQESINLCFPLSAWRQLSWNSTCFCNIVIFRETAPFKYTCYIYILPFFMQPSVYTVPR